MPHMYASTCKDYIYICIYVNGIMTKGSGTLENATQ